MHNIIRLGCLLGVILTIELFFKNKNMQNAFQPQIILLREGTDTSQGKAQIISNINACQAVAETLR